MRNILTSLCLCIAAISTTAQTADIEVSYRGRSFYKNGNERKSSYHLLANATQSKFFNPDSERYDSISSTPEGLARLKETQQAALKSMLEQGSIVVEKLPRKKETMYVIKNSADSMITVYGMIIDEHVYYTEPFDELSWTIGDSTKNVLGYECIIAETDYHGRHWTAWFTPEIPIQDGPWKFRGLPGLILEAYYDNGLGYFADGVEHSAKNITGIYGADKYEKSNRKDILRTLRAISDNPIGALAGKGIKVKVSPSNMPDKSDEGDFLETDYR